MPVEHRTTGRVTLDLDRLARHLGALVVGEILEGADKGVDIDGRPFTGYSDGWKEQLVDMGEGLSVDLRLTGGMLNSIRVLRIEKRGDERVIVIGADTGTSPQVAPPKGKVKKDGTRGKPGRARAQRTGKRGPPHNLVARWINEGTAKMPARRFIGRDGRVVLRPEARAAILRAMAAFDAVK